MEAERALDFEPTDREFEQRGASHRVHHLRRPFERSSVTTDFNGASVNFRFAEPLTRAEAPAWTRDRAGDSRRLTVQ
jgi:hypothetical protein